MAKKRKSSRSDHHCVYVVFLRNPKGDGKAGVLCRHDRPHARSSASRITSRASRRRASSKRCGERLVPRLYAHLNPMPYAKALEMEAILADSLRKRGFTVYGGH